jgi:hypothetical protein
MGMTALVQIEKIDSTSAVSAVRESGQIAASQSREK